MDERNQRGRFLDVSEYVLKEYSPINRALNPDFRLPERNYQLQKYTPQIGPIDHDASTLKITPFLKGLIEIADNQLQDFLLDAHDTVTPEPKSRERAKRQGYRTRQRSNSLVLFQFDNDLQDIVEEEDFEFNSAGDSSSQQIDLDQEEDEEERSVSEHSSEQPLELDQLQLRTQSQFNQKIEKYMKDPKLHLIKQIKRLTESKDLSETERLERVKKTVEAFIVDFEVPCFQQAWQELGANFYEKMETICRGINENFNRKIGALSFEGRRMKLLRYLQKKRMRKWRKKVSYDCRKKVADARLRIKGKFVTRQQVCEQLGLVDIDHFTGDEIRQLLEKRMESKQKSAND